MEFRKVIIVGLLLMIILVIAYTVSKGKKNETAEEKTKSELLKYVKVQEVKNETLDFSIHAHGRVVSSSNINVLAEVSGRLEKGSVQLKSGERFQKGQVLFRIRNVEASLNLQARKSAFLTLIATALPDLKIDFPDVFPEWEAFFGSIDVKEPIPDLPEIKTLKGKTYLASKNILKEYYSIKADEETLSKYTVTAPFSGSFVSVFTEVGTVVNPGAQIANIIQDLQLEVEVPVDVRDILLVREGAEARFTMSGTDREWRGRVVRIGRNVNKTTQSVNVYVAVNPNKDALLYDGMYVETEIMGGRMENVMRLTRNALFEEDQVYVVADSALEVRKVELKQIGNEYNLISGLEDGAEVVVEPITMIGDGVKVIGLN